MKQKPSCHIVDDPSSNLLQFLRHYVTTDALLGTTINHQWNISAEFHAAVLAVLRKKLELQELTINHK